MEELLEEEVEEPLEERVDNVRHVSDIRSCQVRCSSSTAAQRNPRRIDAMLDAVAITRRPR